jgi:hypothetical protein
VRQLKTEQYRERPLHASAPTAFIVGDPDLKGWGLFPQLDSARGEARVVSSLLRDKGYHVVDSIGEQTKDVVEGLHKDAWRILHLAGHGEHDFPISQMTSATVQQPGAAAAQQTSVVVEQPCKKPNSKRVSGMVIGPEAFLTPGDVEQMRNTPELVFINCCHLGQTTTARRVSFSALAANLGVQFIRMGRPSLRPVGPSTIKLRAPSRRVFIRTC